MKNVQLFITKHYDAIKLLLLSVCVILLSYIILTNIAESRLASERRAESIEQAVEQINAKTDEQTVQLNRQLQALCFLIVQTAGQEALKQFDPPLEEQCKNLAQELKQAPTKPEPTYQSPPTQAENKQPIIEPAKPSDIPSQAPESVSPEPKGFIPKVIDTVDNVLKGLIGG